MVWDGTMLGNIRKNAVIMSEGPLDKEGMLDRIVSLACVVYNITEPEQILDEIKERETKLSTGIGLEVALPHCRSDKTNRIVCAVMLVPSGIEFNSIDGKPVKLIFLIISPLEDIRGHIEALSEVSHAVSDEDIRKKLISASSGEELYNYLVSIKIKDMNST